MTEHEDRFAWKWPVGTLVLIVPCSLVLGGLRDFSAFLFCALVFCPAVLLGGGVFMMTTFLAHGRRRRLSFLSATAAFWGLVPLLLGHGVFGPDLADRIRWWTWEGYYRKAVLDQPAHPGELGHVEWDGWGIAGMETTAYLTFDPVDSLADKDGRYRGVPCLVASALRLEPHWYIVTMFTNSVWDACAGDESFPGVETLERGAS